MPISSATWSSPLKRPQAGLLSPKQRHILATIRTVVIRILFFAVVTGAVLTIHVVDNPPWFRKTFAYFATSFHAALFVKDIRVDGLDTLSRLEIEKSLPMEKSVLWWIINTPTIAAKLANSPAIKSAAVVSCDPWVVRKWGCFAVQITERQPRFLVTLDNVRWLVGDDAGFIKPLDNGGTVPEGVVPLDGFQSVSKSSDITRQLVASLLDGLRIVEKETNARITGAALQGSGEFAVKIEGFKFEARFELPIEGGSNLRAQASRFAKLIAELGERAADIESVDLAYNKVAIVKVAKQDPPEKSPVKAKR